MPAWDVLAHYWDTAISGIDSTFFQGGVLLFNAQ
jgi:hypothetical protein